MCIRDRFSNTSPISSLVMTQFSKLTRANMTCKVSQRYFCVARDAVLIVLPILRARRAMFGNSATLVPNPVVEVLQTINKVREWTPLSGKLTLTREDLNGAARMAEDMFKELEIRKYLVQHKRVYIGGGLKSAKPVYVFDTPTLVELLGWKV